ncbi:MAG: 2Fe-2S iron-sulfur cluster-binding protein [Chthoniobacteraceae bacterium]
MSTESIPVTLTINGSTHRVLVEPRRLLSDVLREDCGLTGTHVGCEHGVCGACTILFDGAPARACLIYAVQAEGHEITTIEAFPPVVNFLRCSRRCTRSTGCNAAFARRALS